MAYKNPDMIINQEERDLIEQQLKKIAYPFNNEEFQYETFLGRVNLDKRREQSIKSGKGFVISRPQSSTKKDLKDPNSIFSTKYGPTLNDVNAFGDRYKCECGHIRQKINHGILCPLCNTRVQFVDDDFEFFGWIVLQEDFYVIHPNLFKSIEFYIGKDTFNRIIEVKDEKDINGHSKKDGKPVKDEPYAGIGMIDFKNKFDEIMDYYRKVNLSKGSKSSKKENYYEDIMKNKEAIFSQSIPVYTTLLRPVKLDGKKFHFEGTNSIYNMMASLAAKINNNKLKMNRKRKAKNELLYDLQMKFQELYSNISKMLSGKKGVIRSLFGGRYQFTNRSVIIGDPTLRIDEISMSYYALVELLQQTIINILQKLYNFSYNDAYDIWYKAKITPDSRVVKIIQGMIDNKEDGYKSGIAVIINRNPTIAYGSILQMFVVKMTFNYTMGVPLNILPGLAADFDQQSRSHYSSDRILNNLLNCWNNLIA